LCCPLGFFSKRYGKSLGAMARLVSLEGAGAETTRTPPEVETCRFRLVGGRYPYNFCIGFY